MQIQIKSINILHILLGEAFNSAIGSIPVEYSEQSHIPESLKIPAVNSQETADPPSNNREASVMNSNGDKEISTASGQLRDQQPVVGNVEKSNFKSLIQLNLPVLSLLVSDQFFSKCKKLLSQSSAVQEA